MKETDPDPAAEPRSPAPLDTVLEGLEHRLAAAQAELDTRPTEESAAALASLERDLGRAAVEFEELAGDGAGGHPVVDVALAWEERLRRAGEVLEAGDIGSFAAERLVRDLRVRERPALQVLERWGPEGGRPEGQRPGPRAEPAEPPGDDQAVRVASERTFEALIEVEELRRRVEGRAERIGPAVEIDARTVCDEAVGVQRRLRGALEITLAELDPDAATRRLWADRLVDLSDEALLEASQAQSRRRAARLLGETARALEWHLAAVEKKGRGGEIRARLRRRERRLRTARVEAELEATLEARFGARFVRLWERSILVALALVMVLLAVSFVRGQAGWLVAFDTAICALFLVDFFVKATCVRFHPLWLRRHVLTDFVPALPYAWLATLGSATGPGASYFRIAQFAKYLRVLLPGIRLFRAFTFLMRGLDRLVQRHARELETHVLLFPTPEERRRRAADRREATPCERYWRLRGDLDRAYEGLLEFATPEDRTTLARTRLDALREVARHDAPHSGLGSTDARAASRIDGAPIAEELLQRLGSIRSEEFEGRVGTEAVKRIARAARVVARSPLRFAPVLGRWAPPDASDLPDRRVASRSVRRIARSLARLHGRIVWWADLKGTLTPGELVGRFGSAIVARTARPAIRLLLLSTAYGVLQLALALVGVDAERDPESSSNFLLSLLRGLEVLIGNVLLILGSLCLVLLGIGVWLQRLARDTTDFLERVARAQFLHLTDSVKARCREMDAALVAERVFRPERNLTERDGAREAAARDEARFSRHFARFAAEGVSPPSRGDTGFDSVARAVMLYRDVLDGALLAHSDTRATSQLLGNLAIQRALVQSGRMGPRRVKALRRLDLERRNTFLSGPYPWFHAITRALSSRAARLIVEYNARAIPLGELARVGPDERMAYERWLARATDEEEDARARAAPELTTGFTVLHFLDDAPARDGEVAARFGDAVLERLRADRRALVRTVFGTYPLHTLPREARLVSLRALYDEWVAGGRILFVPLRSMRGALRVLGYGAKALVNAVRAIRDPHRADVVAGDVQADFGTASRKIDRMRAPAAIAALLTRATLDPEYLGLALPLGLHDREERADQVSPRSDARRDAEYLRADPALLDDLAALEQRAARTLGHIERMARGGLVARLESILGASLADDPRTLRALVVLVLGDSQGIRTALLARDVFGEAVTDGLEYGLPRVPLLPPLGVWWRFRSHWKQGGAEEWIAVARRAGLVDEGRAARRRVRRAAWRALWADVDGARAAFAALTDPKHSAAHAEARLAEALRHPVRVTEQLVTLRIVQTLFLIDVRNYRRHVWSLGGYAEEGDPGESLVELPR